MKKYIAVSLALLFLCLLAVVPNPQPKVHVPNPQPKVHVPRGYTLRHPAIPEEEILLDIDRKIMKKDIYCLAANILHEARNQSFKGQLSVAYVTYNRKQDPKFPNTYCGVVYERYQFSWVFNPTLKKKFSFDPLSKEFSSFIQLAKNFLKYDDPTNGATFFHATYVAPKWASAMHRQTEIGDHVFYKSLDNGD